MLENTKKSLHIRIDKQRHRNKIDDILTINLYFSLFGGFLSGGVCPRSGEGGIQGLLSETRDNGICTYRYFK
jgi:hypothetical protein